MKFRIFKYIRKYIKLFICSLIGVAVLLSGCVFPASAASYGFDTYFLEYAYLSVYTYSGGSFVHSYTADLEMEKFVSSGVTYSTLMATSFYPTGSSTAQALELYSGQRFIVSIEFNVPDEYQATESQMNSLSFSIECLNKVEPYSSGGVHEWGYLYRRGSSSILDTVETSPYLSSSNYYAYDFYLPPSEVGVSTSSYQFDLDLLATANLGNLRFRVRDFEVFAGTDLTWDYPNYEYPDTSAIEEEKSATGALFDQKFSRIESIDPETGEVIYAESESLSDSGQSFIESLSSSVESSVTTYSGAIMALTNLITKFMNIPDLYVLFVFSLALGLIPLFVGLSINAIRGSDQRIAQYNRDYRSSLIAYNKMKKRKK